MVRQPRVEGGFGALYCDSVDFQFVVEVDKFGLEEFKKPFHPKYKEPLTSGVSLETVFATRNWKSADYHVHLSWYVSKNTVKLALGYYLHAIEASEGEKEPFAEEAMQWLGKFFKAEKATAHLHIAFEYPADRSRFLFPLPMKVPLGPEPEVEVDGMSVTLQKPHLGMHQAWFISREKISRVLLYGDRVVQFKNFDIIKEIGDLSRFARTFVKEVPNATAE